MDNDFILYILKIALKPGYLYGIGDDGELYCVEATIPKPGETIVMPPLHMPKMERSKEKGEE